MTPFAVLRRALLAPFLFALVAGCATSGTGGGAGAQGFTTAPAAMVGGVMVNARGLTLYTYDKDAPGSGRSACNGICAAHWPPHFATPDAWPTGDYSIVLRDDGRRQWAFKGKPLYTWPEDRQPGDRYSDGYLEVWHVVKN